VRLDKMNNVLDEEWEEKYDSIYDFLNSEGMRNEFEEIYGELPESNEPEYDDVILEKIDSDLDAISTLVREYWEGSYFISSSANNNTITVKRIKLKGDD